MCQIDRKAVLQLAGGGKKKLEREKIKNRPCCVINDWTRGLQGPQSLRRRSGERRGGEPGEGTEKEKEKEGTSLEV